MKQIRGLGSHVFLKTACMFVAYASKLPFTILYQLFHLTSTLVAVRQSADR